LEITFAFKPFFEGDLNILTKKAESAEFLPFKKAKLEPVGVEKSKNMWRRKKQIN